MYCFQFFAFPVFYLFRSAHELHFMLVSFSVIFDLDDTESNLSYLKNASWQSTRIGP